MGLSLKIVLAMTLGIALGILLNTFSEYTPLQDALTYGLLEVVGKMFIASLKMLVVPLVFVSLVCGVCALDDVKKLGKLGGKTLLLYLSTTCIAIMMALSLGLLLEPGEGFNLPQEVSFTPKEAPSLGETIIKLIPTNPFQAAVEGNMLQIIFFSILFGIALAMLGKKGEKMQSLFMEANNVIMNMINFMMKAAPIGVFALSAKVFATQGFEAFQPLLAYFFVVILALFVQGLFVYPTLLRVLSGLNPLFFFRKIRATILFAFSTASSNATLPITMKTVTEKLGVKRSIASFTIPLGATINMDGTAIMQGVATVFIAQAYNVPLTMTALLMVVVSATLASIGTAGVPGVGLITLAMVLRQAGLPVEGIGLIMGVDRLLDMLRTAVNVTGDAVVSCVVAKSEDSFDIGTYTNLSLLDEN